MKIQSTTNFKINYLSLKYLAAKSNSVYVKRRRQDPYAATLQQLEDNVYGKDYIRHIAKAISKGLQFEYKWYGKSSIIKEAIKMGCKFTF